MELTWEERALLAEAQVARVKDVLKKDAVLADGYTPYNMVVKVDDVLEAIDGETPRQKREFIERQMKGHDDYDWKTVIGHPDDGYLACTGCRREIDEDSLCCPVYNELYSKLEGL